MEKTNEVTYIERSYFVSTAFLVGVLVGFFVMFFMTVHTLKKIEGTIDVTKICGVKK